MSTAPSEAHRKLAEEIGGLCDRYFQSRAINEVAQLIADSEARAVEAATKQLRTLETELAAAKCESITHKDLWGKVADELSEAMLELAATKKRLEAASAGALTWAKLVDSRTAELARLRAENERLVKQVKDDNRAYGCELRDPNGTIWEQAAKDHARAENAEAALADLAKRYNAQK